MPSRAERYLAHLDRLSGGQEPRFYPIDSTTPGLERVTAIVYDDIPEPGHVTGCYPIHDSELNYIQDHDLEAFWRLDWDAADTTRPPAV